MDFYVKKCFNLTMKIELQKNWSEQFICGDETPGYFVGRQKEVDSLKNIILENDSSSILVSSVRGVGKTSFVHKTISEAQKHNKDVVSVFVNIGHTLANGDNDKEDNQKKLLLNSLIRATHFNEIFIKNSELEKIYRQSLGNYKVQEFNEEIKNEEKGFKYSLRVNKKELMSLFFVFLTVLGISLSNLTIRYVLGVFGITGLFSSFYWKKEWTKKIFKKDEVIIDDSVEYLEIKFEQWLKDKKNKFKIIFIIDELDKIPEKKSFKLIKEFKNLFTRSFTHFIFIASEEAFNLINSKEDGVFPTLFTHSFYLPLPSSNELREYLDKIIKTKQNDTDIKSYLLFKAKNDFFELKKIILDYIQHDSNGPFLDIDLIKKEDFDYEEIAKLYNFVDLSMQKYLKQLKRYWKDNSILQKDFFNFLLDNLNINFDETVLKNENKELLSKLLFRAGIIQENGTDENGTAIYAWTHNYQIKQADDLFGDEEKFIESFYDLIKTANDLDDLPEKYVDNSFEDYEEVSDTRDGRGLSGINLFSLYIKYKDLHENLKEKKNLLSIKLENSQKALEEIKQNIDNVLKKYFLILKNLINSVLSPESSLFFKEETLAVNNFNTHGTIKQFPDFYQNFTNIEHSICGKIDQSKYVFILKDFKEFEKIKNGLDSLNNNKNVLFINVSKGDKKEIRNAFMVKETQKGRRKGSNKIEISNFINYTFENFRDFSEILIKIKDFLK